MKRVIIAGSRNFNDHNLLEKMVCSYMNDNDLTEIEIVSGCAKGADLLGEKFADNNGFDVKKFPADWKNLNVKPCKVKKNKYGSYNSLAGFNRNKKMAEYGDVLIAYWNEKSSGTASMIRLATEYGLEVIVISY